MTERDPMKALGDLARERAREPVPEELARPFDEAELERLTAGVAAALPARRARVLSWRGPALGAVLAAAAAVVFLVRAPGPASDLPVYDLTFEGASRGDRGAVVTAPDVLSVDRAAHLVIVARPRAPASGVDAEAWVESPPGVFTRWHVAARRSDEGAFRFDATPTDLAALPAGKSRLVVFVGPSAHLPAEPRDAARAMKDGAAGVQTLPKEIEVSGP